MWTLIQHQKMFVGGVSIFRIDLFIQKLLFLVVCRRFDNFVFFSKEIFEFEADSVGLNWQKFVRNKWQKFKSCKVLMKGRFVVFWCWGFVLFLVSYNREIFWVFWVNISANNTFCYLLWNEVCRVSETLLQYRLRKIFVKNEQNYTSIVNKLY